MKALFVLVAGIVVGFAVGERYGYLYGKAEASDALCGNDLTWDEIKELAAVGKTS